MRPLCCAHSSYDTAARTVCQSCFSTELPASYGGLAHLHFRQSLGRYLCPLHVLRHCVFGSDQLSTLASQQHFPSPCSYSSQKVDCEEESVPVGAGRGVCDAQSPSPYPSPQHNYSELNFKARVRAGMNTPISLSWCKRHGTEKRQIKGFGGKRFLWLDLEGQHQAPPFCSFQHEVYIHRDPHPISGSPSSD